MNNLQLEKIITNYEINLLKKTQNLHSKYSSFENWLTQSAMWFTPTYKLAVMWASNSKLENIENPLKTILITSWLAHAVKERKLTYKRNPIRLNMNDHLEFHLWDFSLRRMHYTMCVNSLYWLYEQTHNRNKNTLSLDTLRVYPALFSGKPMPNEKERAYLKVRIKLAQQVRCAFHQHKLVLPNSPENYNSLSSNDVTNWFNLILEANNVDPLQAQNEIKSNIDELQVLWNELNQRSKAKKSKNVQPVGIKF